jgi:hypothetical protein
LNQDLDEIIHQTEKSDVCFQGYLVELVHPKPNPQPAQYGIEIGQTIEFEDLFL